MIACGPASEVYFQIRQTCNEADDVEALKKLLPAKKHHGKDFAAWPTERPLLHALVKHGCIKCVSYLLNDLKFDVNTARADGCTPLHMAQFSLKGKGIIRQEMTEMLMKLGADPTAENKWGERCVQLERAPQSLSVHAHAFIPSSVKSEMTKQGMVYEGGHFYFFQCRSRSL